MTLQQGGVGGAPPAAPLARPVSDAGAMAALEKRAPSRLISRALYLVALFVATVIFVFPFVWLVSARPCGLPISVTRSAVSRPCVRLPASRAA